MMRANRSVLLFVVTLAAGLMASAEATARTERLRWSHADPSGVDAFRVYVGTLSGSYETVIDASVPGRDTDGSFVFDIEVDDAAMVYVAVSAMSDGIESELSNERSSAPDGGGADPPDGGGGDPPAGAEAAVVGFALWDAESDSVVDADFESGDSIDLASHGCTVIEVLVNDYLALPAEPGSVLFVFDGNTPESCDESDVTHENDPPYEWGPQLSGTDFDCAEELTLPGSHVLTVTPYDGNGCTGAAGTSATLNFEVIAAPVVVPPEPVGQPGRPTLMP